MYSAFVIHCIALDWIVLCCIRNMFLDVFVSIFLPVYAPLYLCIILYLRIYVLMHEWMEGLMCAQMQ